MTTKTKVALFTSAGGEGSIGLIKSVIENLDDMPNIDLVYVALAEAYGGVGWKTDRYVADYIWQYLTRTGVKGIRFSHYGGGFLDSAMVGQLHNAENLEKPDVGILAGYRHYASALLDYIPLLNIHPAKPYQSKGKWWDECLTEVLEDGYSTAGVTLHYVTDKLDDGEPYASCEFPVVMAAIPFKQQRDFLRKDIMRHEQRLLVDSLKTLDIKKIKEHTKNTQYSIGNSPADKRRRAAKKRKEAKDAK